LSRGNTSFLDRSVVMARGKQLARGLFALAGLGLVATEGFSSERSLTLQISIEKHKLMVCADAAAVISDSTEECEQFSRFGATQVEVTVKSEGNL
jgi:hypothetical protein